MKSSAINSGDKFFLKNPTPPGTVKSLYDIKGVSGAGEVVEAGEGVPDHYAGKNVSFYRQLKYSESVVGSWSEYAHVHYLDCVILPDEVDAEEYSGSVVNIITPFAFLRQIKAEGHAAIISTAGNSATGIALLALCLNEKFPLISIVRSEAGRIELEGLGAQNIVVQNQPNFNQQLQKIGHELKATAVFEGIGGDILNKIIPVLPYGSVIYSYGFIGDATPLSVHTSMLSVKNLTIKPFSNLKTATVQDPGKLAEALAEIGKVIQLRHFKTKIGKRFRLEEIEDAIAFKVENGRKAILVH